MKPFCSWSFFSLHFFLLLRGPWRTSGSLSRCSSHCCCQKRSRIWSSRGDHYADRSNTTRLWTVQVRERVINDPRETFKRKKKVDDETSKEKTWSSWKSIESLARKWTTTTKKRDFSEKVNKRRDIFMCASPRGRCRGPALHQRGAAPSRYLFLCRQQQQQQQQKQ